MGYPIGLTKERGTCFVGEGDREQSSYGVILVIFQLDSARIIYSLTQKRKTDSDYHDPRGVMKRKKKRQTSGSVYTQFIFDSMVNFVVIVKNASDLANIQLFGTQDPYVEVATSSDKKRTQTNNNGGKNPSINNR